MVIFYPSGNFFGMADSSQLEQSQFDLAQSRYNPNGRGNMR